MEESKDLCAVCESSASLFCGSCFNVRYCTKEHQRLHWSDHKYHCRAFRIDVNEKFGRFMVATRNLKTGELIFREKALVCGPKEGSIPLCLTCYSPLEQHVRCTQCNIPFCSDRCANSTAHVTECSILSSAKNRVKITDFQNVHRFYDCVMPLRCLLLSKYQPQKYQAVDSLQDHTECRRGTELWAVVQNNVVNFLRGVCQMKEFNEEMIHSTCGRLDVNAFEIKLGRNHIRGLYPMAAMMAHSCIANTNHVIREEDYELSVYASVPIKKGQALFLNYASPLDGTKERRAYLHQSKFFICDCQRCADPTECGTFLSALKCPECSKGWLLPIDPIDDESVWKCDKCFNQMESIKQSVLVDGLKKELESIETRDVDWCERYMKRYESQLHPNHFLLTSVRHQLIHLYGHDVRFSLPSLSNELLERKVDLCQSLLTLANILEPGQKRLRGEIIYEMYGPRCIQLKKSYEADEITSDEFKDRISKVCELLEEALAIFSLENEDSWEKRMGNVMESAHAQLHRWMAAMSS